MDKKNIVIIGYPKSGTTWLSRLVAELISCPLQGDWGFDNLKAPYQEGLERNSNYNVYKSHHIFNEVEKASEHEIYKIIYIIRDPRDVVISGINYFNFYPKTFSRNTPIKKLPLLKKISSHFVSEKEKKKEMIKAVFSGNKAINQWLSTSWKSHYEPYSKKNILFIKFEDLVKSPKKESLKILDYLNIQITNKHLEKSINIQSLENRKKIDLNKKDEHQKKILRIGNFGYWKNEFSEDEKCIFKKNLTSNYYNF